VGAAAVAPLLFAGVSYLTRGRFEPDEDLLNSAKLAPEISLETAPPMGAVSAGVARYDALAPAAIGVLVVCLVAGSVLAWRLKPESIGDYLKLSVNLRTVRAKADEAM